jgi:hypothetical protein
MNALKTALAALIVLGSASAVLADDHTDHASDAMRNYGPVVQKPAQLTTKNVSLPLAKQSMDFATQTFGGGY